MILPTHPMFGPFVSSVAGQIFVLTPADEAKNDARYMFLVNYLKKS
jgi:prephenate dehydrogenase